ncbi:hypothetical protein K469DRAFT_705699, partial [Zopfia rhizophila CBS 207.26]
MPHSPSYTLFSLAFHLCSISYASSVTHVSSLTCITPSRHIANQIQGLRISDANILIMACADFFS